MTRHRGLDAALIIAVVCGLVAGGFYWRYSKEWLRRPAAIGRCATASGRALRQPAVVSGTEPHQTPDGETVYLVPAEDMAVRCVQAISSEKARQLAGAFSEHEPELRGLELLKVLRDVPPGQDNDRMAHTVYRIASGAMIALPPLPETKAAVDELDELYACRFDTKLACPRRPPMPWQVWVFGVPGALALIFAAILGLPRLFRGARAAIGRWREARKARKASAAAAKAGGAKAGAAGKVTGKGATEPAVEDAAAAGDGAAGPAVASTRSAPPAARRRKKSKRPPPADAGPEEGD